MSVKDFSVKGRPMRLSPKETHFFVGLAALETSLKKGVTRVNVDAKGLTNLFNYRIFVDHGIFRDC